jgi:hypothetical protein
MFYVYEARIEGEVIYVGKGTKSRYTHCHRKWKNCEVEIIEYFNSAEDAFRREEELIKQYGRIDLGTGTLFNRSNGGKYIKGSSPWKGKSLSLEHKEKIKIGLKGKSKKPKYGDENPFYGKKHTEETKQKISMKRQGIPSGFKGRKHTEEAKEKNRLVRLGKPSKKKLPIDKDTLVKLKDVDKLTNKQIAEYFGCSLFPIKKALRELKT